MRIMQYAIAGPIEMDTIHTIFLNPWLEIILVPYGQVTVWQNAPAVNLRHLCACALETTGPPPHIK